MRFPLNLTNAPRKLLPEVKKSIRAKVPVLTVQDLRRFKEPLAVALECELEEEECLNSLEIFKKVIKMDTKHIFRYKRHSKLLLDVYENVKKVDKLPIEGEIEHLVEYARTLFDKDPHVDFIIESLLLHATDKIKSYRLTHTKLDAITKFTQGRCLFHRLNWLRAALLHFEYAFQISLPHNDWTIDDVKASHLIAIDLASCSIQFSKELRKDRSTVSDAIVCSKRALTVLRHDLEMENLPLEIDAEMEFAACWFDFGDYDNAVSHFKHAAALAERCGLKERYCECVVEAGKCFGS
jgi:tetratricopeptide (TPR) repeat protein